MYVELHHLCNRLLDHHNAVSKQDIKITADGSTQTK